MESHLVATDQRFPVSTLPLLGLHDIDHSTKGLAELKEWLSLIKDDGKEEFFLI